MNKINEFLSQFIGEFLETIALTSYDFLVVAGLIALILYVFGWKKGKDVSLMCPAIYVIIQIISKVILNAR